MATTAEPVRRRTGTSASPAAMTANGIKTKWNGRNDPGTLKGEFMVWNYSGKTLVEGLLYNILMFYPIILYPMLFILSCAVLLVYGSWETRAMTVAVFSLFVLIPMPYIPKFRRKMGSIYSSIVTYPLSLRVRVPARLFTPKIPYIFVTHPHGRMFFSTALFVSMWHKWTAHLVKGELFTGVLPVLLAVPIAQQWLRMMGLVSVDQRTLSKKLSSGHHINILVGGVKEVLLGTRADADELYIKSRLGFCQLAIDNNAGLVPVFAFGENDLFEPTPQKWLDWWGKVNQRYFRIGALWPIRGRFGLPIPFRRHMMIVMGKPVFPRPGDTPQILLSHYIAALEALYAEHVSDFQPGRNLILH